MTGLALVEDKTKSYSESYSKLRDKLMQLDEDVSQIKKKYMPAIKKLADEVNEKHSVLATIIAENSGSFEKPRTVVFHGIKVGLQKGRGKMEFDNDQTVKLIKKHFPEKADVLIIVTEKPANKALEQLSVVDLKKIGVNVVDAKDEPYIKSTDSEIEKMVEALISEDKKAQKKNSAEAS